jgi:hypothetical protein
MDAASAAKNFLHGQPADWLRIADQIAPSVARLMTTRLRFHDVSQVRSQVAEAVFAELTDPSFLHILAGSDRGERADSTIAEAIATRLSDTFLELPAGDGLLEEEIVDVTTDGDDREYAIRRIDRWGDDYLDWDDSPSILSEYKPVTLVPDLGSLTAIVERSVTENAAGERATGERAGDGAVASLVRLDVIDVALYRVLTQHPDLLKSLHWRTFEKLLADIMSSFGFEVELQRGTKDGGVDLFAVKRLHPLGPQRYLLQAKRWQNSVGVEPVRHLAFLHSHYKATKSCLATTASFTRGAWELANQYRWQLELKDFEGLKEWVREAARVRDGTGKT